MAGTLGRNHPGQRIHRLLRPQPALHVEPVQPARGRHGARAHRHRRHPRHTRGHLGRQRARLAHPALCLRQDRGRVCDGQHQLQTGRTGIPLQELGHAHPLHRQRREGQRLRPDDLHDAARTAHLPARTPQERTLPRHAQRRLRGPGEIPRHVHHPRAATPAAPRASPRASC